MKVVAMIPARYGSTRFPGKMLASLGGKPLIVRTYEAALATGLFDEVYVVSDDQRIEEAVVQAGGRAIRSQHSHETGSDRIAEAVQELECDIVVNVQGDEPFITRAPLEQLLAVFDGPDADRIDLATLIQELKVEELIRDPNYCKVVKDKDNFALYFSRSAIPYPRAGMIDSVRYYEHVGVYAFRKASLLAFTAQQQLQNEAIERIECIRYLEYGLKIKLVEAGFVGVEIDTPADLAAAEEYLHTLTMSK